MKLESPAYQKPVDIRGRLGAYLAWRNLANKFTREYLRLIKQQVAYGLSNGDALVLFYRL
ncbi:hypothetical protein MAH4_23960 [Sessilibacter sp. MAH4]